MMLMVFNSRIMRSNKKLLLLFLLTSGAFVGVTLWSKCNDPAKDDSNFFRDLKSADNPEVAEIDHELRQKVGAHLNQVVDQDLAEAGAVSPSYTEIDCLINDEYTIEGRREGNEVFLPFSFVEKYFEVYGKIVPTDSGDRFEWHHSFARVYHPQEKYTTDGVFMSFAHYNVEIRDRVKCISGIEGVPLSTQWGPQGYFYPIQIAQFGLSHYSKNIIGEPATKTVVETGDSKATANWKVPDGTMVQRVKDPHTGSRFIHFQAPDEPDSPGVTLPLDVSKTYLSMDFKFATNGSITVEVEVQDKDQPYYVHYVCSRTLIIAKRNHIYYGIGDRKQWSRITRDVAIDVQKGIYLNKRKKYKLVLQKIVGIELRGEGWVDNITLSNIAHMPQFYDAANWLVRHQDSKGGWPIMVTRRLANGRLELPPGWYSAMAQGHAMSLLTRAYKKTGNSVYIEAALKAAALYHVPSEEGGIRAMFMDKHVWYEEYPTTPSSFVLNGFIYSLLGLYDLKSTVPPSKAGLAESLYKAGIESLKAMLLLYDTGSGTIYDLRHLTLGVAPNLARWDYHATHVNQLLLLATIDDSPIFRETAQRWIEYMKGKRAPHN